MDVFGFESVPIRRVGSLVGFLVRDALGVGFEFKTPNLLPPAQLVATKAL